MKGKINGQQIADEIIEELEEYSGKPSARILLVGDDAASETFVQQKKQLADRIGFNLDVDRYSEDVGQEQLLNDIERMSKDEEVDGMLVQLPLPEHLDGKELFAAIPPKKDIDGLTPRNLGKLVRGEQEIAPAAVKAVLEILDQEGVELEGSDVTIVNDSPLIGRPLAMALTDRGATVRMCHKKTENLEEKTQESDIVVTATGEHGLITPEMVKEGAVVIDAGYEQGEGDIERSDEIGEKALIAEVPGGIGPVTVACTMENLKYLHEKHS